MHGSNQRCRRAAFRPVNWVDNQDVKLYAEIPELTNERASLLGVRVSAVLLVALGCLWGFYAIFFVVILGMTGVRAWEGRAHDVGNFVGPLHYFFVVVVMTALTWLCLRAAAALRDARRWGAYVAMASGLLLLLFTVSFTYDIYHPERQGPNDYFGILFVPFALLVGLWWCIYLNLPHVRTYLNTGRPR